MELRTRTRYRTALSPVRVMGMDSAGKPFLESASTLNLTPDGVCLAGFQSQAEVSASVVLRYQCRQSRFSVVWARASACGSEFKLGLKCLEPQKDIWNLGTAPTLDVLCRNDKPGLKSPTGPERRRFVRYPVDLWARIIANETNRNQWVRLGDIGLTGCYCWTKQALPERARVWMTTTLGESKVAAMGVVRTSHPTVGMGIEFTAMASPEDGDRLGLFLATLQGGRASHSFVSLRGLM